MEKLPETSKYVARADEAVTDQDRATINQQLNQMLEEGKMDEFEYRNKLDVLYQASTLGELVPVVEKLPAPQTYSEPAIVKQTGSLKPGELAPVNPAVNGILLAAGGIGVLVILAIIFVLIF